jgi:hypothetical protein
MQENSMQGMTAEVARDVMALALEPSMDMLGKLLQQFQVTVVGEAAAVSAVLQQYLARSTAGDALGQGLSPSKSSRRRRHTRGVRQRSPLHRLGIV